MIKKQFRAGASTHDWQSLPMLWACTRAVTLLRQRLAKWLRRIATWLTAMPTRDEHDDYAHEALMRRGWHRINVSNDAPEGDATAPFTGFFTNNQDGGRNRRRR